MSHKTQAAALPEASRKRAWKFAALAAEIILFVVYLSYRLHFYLHRPLTDREDVLSGYVPPSPAERNMLTLLQARFEAVKDKNVFPIGCGGPSRDKRCDVADALESLDHEVVLPPICGHAMVIRSRLNHWRTKLPVAKTIFTKKRDGHEDPRYLGYYRWYVVEYFNVNYRDTHSKDALVFSNQLYLNANEMGRNEGDAAGRIENMGIFYHQLLHCQFVIDAMRNDDKWKRALCMDSSDVELGPMDAEHHRIWDLDGKFVRALTDLAKVKHAR